MDFPLKEMPGKEQNKGPTLIREVDVEERITD